MQHRSENRLQNRRTRPQFRRTGMPVLAFGLLAVVCLGQLAAHAQSQLGAAESCFEAGPDRVPAIAATPIPPVRTWFKAPAQLRPTAAASSSAARLTPAGFTPLKSMPIHLLNAGAREHWTPAPKQSPEFLAAAR